MHQRQGVFTVFVLQQSQEYTDEEPILRRTALQADATWCAIYPRALPPVTQSSALQAPERIQVLYDVTTLLTAQMPHIALCCLEGSTMSNLVHRRRRCARIVNTPILLPGGQYATGQVLFLPRIERIGRMCLLNSLNLSRLSLEARQKPNKPLGEDGGRCPAVMLPPWSYKSELLTPKPKAYHHLPYRRSSSSPRR